MQDNGDGKGRAIAAGNGNDTLTGGLGVDTLTGGANDRIFVFYTALAGSADRITEYNVAQDTIHITGTSLRIKPDAQNRSPCSARLPQFSFLHAREF